MPRIRTALDQIGFARAYVLPLIESIPPDRWFDLPQPDTTHVAWQVGHLATAQFALVHVRWRGDRPDDDAIIAKPFRAAFGRDSVPVPDPTVYPSPDVIRATLDRVHAYTLRELPGRQDAECDGPMMAPHRFCTTRGECLVWAAAHEMLHAGQIGLLRRLLGHPPVW